MPLCCQSLPILSLPQTLAPAISAAPSRSCNVFRSDFEMMLRLRLRLRLRRRRGNGNVCLAGDGSRSRAERDLEEHLKKRSIVEHLLLLSAKADLSEDEEKDMLDHLYTSQYQMNDFESEVDEDILSIFRRGAEFDYGVECIVLLSIFKMAPRHAVRQCAIYSPEIVYRVPPLHHTSYPRNCV